MRFLKITLLVALVGFCVVLTSQAATLVNVSVSARLNAVSPDMTVIIKELTTAGQDPWSGATVSTMDFGILTHLLTSGAEAGVWYSPKYFCALILAYGNSYKYEVKSTCAGLTTTTANLPTGSFMLAPDYSTLDKWNPGDPTGQGTMHGTLGTKAPAIATDKSIYKSEAGTTAVPPKDAIIRAFYSIPNAAPSGSSGWQGIPLSQQGGVYSGTVTITIAPY